MSGNEWMFFVALFVTFVWLLYMATFRTRDFIDLMKAEEERKKNRAARLESATKAGFSIARWFLK